MNLREVCSASCFSCKSRQFIVRSGLSVSTLSDVRVVNVAGSFFYESSYLSRRFILWRSHCEFLQLEEHSLDSDLISNQLSIQIENSLIIRGVNIFETEDQIVVVVPTIDSVHIFNFGHPNHFRRQSLSSDVTVPVPSVFCEGIPRYQFKHTISPPSGLLPLFAACSLSQSQEPVVALAFSDGSIQMLTFSAVGTDGSVSQDILRPQFTVKRMLSGLMPFTRNDTCSEQISSICMCPYAEDMHLCTVSSDNKFRVWSCRQKESRCQLDLLSFLPEYRCQVPGASVHSHDAQPSELRKTLNSDCFYLLAASLWFDGNYKFLVLAPNSNAETSSLAFTVVAILQSPGVDLLLVDYCFCQSHFYSLYLSSANETLCFSSGLDLSTLKVGGWEPVELVNSPSSADSLVDKMTIINYVFRPGNFSMSDVIRALKVTCRGQNVSQQVTGNINWQSLRSFTKSLMTDEANRLLCERRLNDDQLSAVESILWQDFYSNCLQYHMAGSKPLALLIGSETELSGIIRQEFFSLFCNVGSLNNLIVSSANSFDFDCSSLAECLHLFISYRKSFRVADGVEGGWLLAKGLVDDLVENERHTHFIHAALAVVAPVVDKLPTYIGNVLTQLDYSSTCKGLDSLSASNGGDQFSVTFGSSALGGEILAATCELTFRNYGDIIHGLSFLVAFLTRYVTSTTIPLLHEELKLLQDVITPSLDMLDKAYDVLNWIADLQVEEVSHNVLECNIMQMANLSVGSAAAAPLSVKTASGLSSVIYSFVDQNKALARRLFHQLIVKEELDPPLSFPEAVDTFTKVIIYLLWPTNPTMTLAEYFLSFYQHNHLERYCKKIAWCDELKFCRLFYEGCAYLNLQSADEAFDLFSKAFVGIQCQNQLLLRLLFPDQDNVVDAFCPSEYYLKVIRLFESCGYLDHVIKFAKLALQVATSDTNQATLWTILFKYNMQLHDYDEAFVAIKNNPKIESKTNCLRMLVVSLTEQRHVERLVTFPYGKLEAEVIDIIETRARAVDLTTHDYYSVLFAFFIHRMNYRRAGACMFEYAQRLSREVPDKMSLERQVKCYLACISALNQARSDYMWIVCPNSLAVRKGALVKSECESGMSPKRTSEDVEIYGNPTRRLKLEVVELKRIKLEYQVAKARLLLAKRMNLSSASTSSVTDVVSLLLQHDFIDTALIITKAAALPLTPIFEALANKCVGICQRAYDPNKSKELSFPQESKLFGTGALALTNNASDQAWSLLDAYLEGLTAKENCSLYASVARRLLSLNHPLPSWLIARFKSADFAELLRLLIEFNQISDACVLLVDYIDIVTHQLNSKTDQTAQVYIPYTSVDHLLHILEEHGLDPKFKGLLSELEAKLTKYFDDLEQKSKVVCSLRR